MLQLDALRALRSPRDIANLYHLLGYAADLDPVDSTPEDAQLLGAAAEDVQAVYLLVDQDDLQHIHVVVKGGVELAAFPTRRIAEQFLRRPGHYLLSFSDARFQKVVFLKPHRSEGAAKFSRLVVQPHHPTAHDLSVLREIAVTPHLSAETAHGKQIAAFNVERVTRKFYDEYRKLFTHVRDVVRTENPRVVIRTTPRKTTDDRDTLHGFTQRLLGRLLFLYFIQKKGWLDGRSDFMVRLYRDTVQDLTANFYRDALEPLFFETLCARRDGDGSPFGRVPYLNGSLFEREYPQDTVLNLPNSLFDPSVPESILHLMENYNFTVEESGSLDQDVSLDPEMLGKVFENMMEEEEAAQSGTFYTPRSIVQFMAEETLTRYLADTTGLPQERLLPLCAESDDAGDLTIVEARRIVDALGKVRVLDPAVGTASMLVGMLAAMIRVRRSAEHRLGVTVTPGSSAVGQWKREYIAHCLYGVDIKQEAIEIARLRLWLSLVVDAVEPEPLPSLDYKLMAGDGLLETVDGEPFIKAQQAIVGVQGEIEARVREIEARHEAFSNEQDPERRHALRGQIQDLEREIFALDTNSRIRDYDAEIRDLERKITDPRQGEKAKERFAKRIGVLREAVGRLIEQRVKVRDEHEPLPFFLHGVHFAEVMKGQGGFDIVIGNPPYVSIINMPASYKSALKRAFPEVEAGRADLYVYFFQKGFNLLRDGGRLAYITPNKFTRAVYGEKLRVALTSQVSLDVMVDFGDLPVFDATTYPFITLVRKSKPSGDDIYILPERTLKASISNTEGGTLQTRAALSSFHEYARKIMSPVAAQEFGSQKWTLDDPRVLRLMDKLREKGVPLSHLAKDNFYRGIVTGYNDAFVIKEAKRQEMIDMDPKSAEAMRPLLRGRDIRRWRVNWSGLYLLVINRGFPIDDYPAIKAHLEEHREALSERATVGNHKWYELQQPQEAYQKLLSGPKITYNKFQVSPKFAFDDQGYYVNDAIFFISGSHYYLVPLLNSSLGWFMITQTCASIQNGYQLMGDYFGRVSIAIPNPSQQAILESITDDSRLDELNAVVYEMYGLTDDEIALVESLTAGAYAVGAGDGAVGAEDEAEAAGAPA